MNKFSRIVVHGGEAHLDEFTACAVAFAARALQTGDPVSEVLAPIERRDPTPEELEDPGILVLDVGGVLDPDKGDYDHHQLPRGNEACAMTLLADDIVDGTCSPLRDFLSAVYPWFETRAVVDSCGPYAAAGAEGVAWSTVEKFLGPAESVLLTMFRDAEPEHRAKLCGVLAADIVGKYDAWDEVAAAMQYPAVGEVEVMDFTGADPKKVDAVSGAMTRGHRGAALFHDNRGDGLAVLRLGDDPRLDFSRVGDDPRVAFAHAGGFIAKTKSKSVEDALDLVRLATVG